LLILGPNLNNFAVSKGQNKKTLHMDTKMIGNKIAKARKDKNMSQAQLAGLLFISPRLSRHAAWTHTRPGFVNFSSKIHCFLCKPATLLSI